MREEAAAAPVVTEQVQPQQPERPLNRAPLTTQGWEQLEGWIDRLVDAVSRLALQLAEKEGRPGAAEMAAGEPVVGAVRSIAGGGWGARNAQSSGDGRGTIGGDSPGGKRESSRPTSPTGASKGVCSSG
ncbi:unnamed protein product [Lampetra planeri]